MPAIPVELGRAAVIVNPTKVTDGARVRSGIEQAFSDGGWARPLWLETTADDPGFGQTRQALDEGVDLVCALGGDGTVRVVGSGLVGSGVPLGILPGGTGNLLARQLEMGLESMDAALDVVLQGEDLTIDVGDLLLRRANGDEEQHHFLVMSGVGFDAKVMSEAPEELKKRVGWLAYALSGLKNLPGRRVKARLTFDEDTVVGRRMRTVIIANCGRLTGGMELVPTASIRDGRLDTVVLSPRGLIGWAGLAAAVATKRRKGHRLLEHTPCESVDVALDNPISVELDGDPMGAVVGVHARVLPGALRVRVAPGTR